MDGGSARLQGIFAAFLRRGPDVNSSMLAGPWRRRINPCPWVGKGWDIVGITAYGADLSVPVFKWKFEVFSGAQSRGISNHCRAMGEIFIGNLDKAMDASRWSIFKAGACSSGLYQDYRLLFLSLFSILTALVVIVPYWCAWNRKM